jgi:hypothetical protein
MLKKHQGTQEDLVILPKKEHVGKIRNSATVDRRLSESRRSFHFQVSQKIMIPGDLKVASHPWKFLTERNQTNKSLFGAHPSASISL